MAEIDEGRIEGRLAALSSGSNATFDSIREMESRVAEHERNSRSEPSKSFGAVLKNGKTPTPVEENLSEKQRNFERLPSKGPRPSSCLPSLDSRRPEAASAQKIVLKG